MRISKKNIITRCIDHTTIEKKLKEIIQHSIFEVSNYKFGFYGYDEMNL